MTAFVSPGVYTTETDLSQYAARISTAILGLVGTASKGPMNTVTLITNESQLINTFGKPIVDVTDPSNLTKNTPMLLAAMQYLRQGNQLWVVRVGNGQQDSTVNVTDDGEDDGSTIFTATANSAGTWANGIKIRISNVVDATDFDLTIMVNGVAVEKFESVSLASDEVNPLTGESAYIHDVINGVSEYITISGASGSTAPFATDYTMAGGTNGLTSSDADYIGVDAPTRTGLQIFEDAEAMDINLLAIPGVTSIAVWLAMTSLCASRGDCLALLDTQYGLSVQDVDAFANASGNYTARGTAINSNYAAVYWPWIKVYEPYSGQNTWMPPSGFVAARMAYTDRVANPWFAPAGTDRGRLLEAQDVEISAGQGDREFLQAPAHIVNPIVNFAREGVTIWGQRTSQRQASALDRVNVRRMMLYARKVIATTLRVLVFEPNDAQTWRRFVGLVSPVFNYIKSSRGVIDFQVICDETTNPPEQVDNNTMKGVILIKPTKTAEVIEVDFTLLSTGAEFQEFTEA